MFENMVVTHYSVIKSNENKFNI